MTDNDSLYRDDYDQPRKRDPEPVGVCSKCVRPRYSTVPQFPKTSVCVCAPELPPLESTKPEIRTCPVCLRAGLAALPCPCGFVPDDPPLPPLDWRNPPATLPPMPPPSPPPPQPFALQASDPAASYMMEICAAWLEGDAVAAFGWLFGLFNNHGSMRADPENTGPLRQHAQQMRDYWVTMNPQGGK